MNNLRTGSFQHSKSGTTSRVFADIDGSELWFESDDIDLQPSVEALATLWLIPSLLSKRNLEVTEPVCAKWLENAHRIIELLDYHWGAKPVEIFAKPVEKKAETRTATGLFFTCGVDSFFTFYEISSVKKPDYLIHIESFDIPANEPNRSKATRERLEKVASAVGCRLITIRTNVKKHPTFTAHRIADTHAAILAAAGHLLTPHIVSATIAPSWHKDHYQVFGSNWQLDPLWSSASLEIIHGNSKPLRMERVKAIVDQQLVQQSLHVCFETHNCSRCEKCVRTMLDLYLTGQLPKFEVFDRSIPIWQAIDNLPRILLIGLWEPAFHSNADPQVDRALRQLFRRTSLAATAVEEQLKQRRYVDEEFPKLKEGLENALNHYSQLQEEHQRLAADYAAIAGNLPIRNGIKLIRKVARKLRASGTTQGARHD